MPYMSPIERILFERGYRKGFEEGFQEGFAESILPTIAGILETKFGSAGKRLMRKLRAVKEVERLRKLVRALRTAKSLDEIRLLVG